MLDIAILLTSNAKTFQETLIIKSPKKKTAQGLTYPFLCLCVPIQRALELVNLPESLCGSN